ncbi:MAG: RNA polymerase sigma factor [Niastella sp.]|nr:RNA polymerase sigma factor [Niastella sp.]
MNIAWKNIAVGDKKAYSTLYLQLYERFYNYGVKFTADAAVVEDTVQEVLLSIWYDRQQLGDLSNPEAYFFAAFRNNLFRKLNTLARQLPVEMGESEPEFARDAILINEEIDTELRQRLQKAIDTLTPRQREAIFLRFYEGLAYDEVATALGITTKATYKIMARALLELKGKMSLPIIILLALLRNSD